jgi:hypothetical protein
MEIDKTLSVESVRVPVWAWLLAAVAVVALYGLTLENGFVLQAGADVAHELFHDARHMLGVPCH